VENASWLQSICHSISSNIGRVLKFDITNIENVEGAKALTFLGHITPTPSDYAFHCHP
jgi:hypothetical protein